MQFASLSLVTAFGLFVAATVSAQQPKPGAPPAPAPQSKPAAKDSPLPTLNMVVPQRDRDAAYAYYRDEIAAGRCPTPLVRKDKTCGAPPAPTARAWKLDQPLPDGVKADAPPPGLIAKLSPSPAGHQYLRVDTDILVIGLGTRNVAALVVDLSRLQ
ncbi:MAG: hypothetical protein HYX38_15770 [Rhodospirillales bacterium]|nr:hypothetical protein [Rhodospirillales bacterium]